MNHIQWRPRKHELYPPLPSRPVPHTACPPSIIHPLTDPKLAQIRDSHLSDTARGKMEAAPVPRSEKEQTKMEADESSIQQPLLSLLGQGELDPLGALNLVDEPAVKNKQTHRAKSTMVESVKYPNDASTSRTNNQRATCHDTFGRNFATVQRGKKSDVVMRWNEQKKGILKEFSSTKFRMNADIFADVLDDEPGASNGEVAALMKTKTRLAQFETAEGHSGDDESLEVSERELSERIEWLQRDLKNAWGIGQKVLSLRIAIKSFKLLGDTSAPAFYPSMFVLISDTLDTLGELVFDRIRAKAVECNGNSASQGSESNLFLMDNFTSSDVPVQSKETCRNWFYKTACIRELLPRIYTEMALIPCYRFLSDGEYPQIVSRLSNMIRGIGDPLVALYARLYLALMTRRVLPTHEKKFAIISSFYDYLFTFREFAEKKLYSYLTIHSMSEEEYYALHSPAVQWILQCCSENCDQEVVDRVISHYREYCQNGMVLMHLMDAFPGELLAPNKDAVMSMISLIRQAQKCIYSNTQLYSCLAKNLVDAASSQTAPHSAETVRKSLGVEFLNDIWKEVHDETNLAHYMQCAKYFIQLIKLYYSEKEMLVLLNDVVLHLNSGVLEDVEPLETILFSISTPDVDPSRSFSDYLSLGKLLTCSEFMSLMHVYSTVVKDKTKVKMLLFSILQGYINSTNCSSIVHCTDNGTKNLITHGLIEYGVRLHDSLDSLSLESERHETTQLLIELLTTLKHCCSTASSHSGSEWTLALLENELQMWVHCRKSFHQLEGVLHHLVLCTANLCLKAHMVCTRTGKASSAALKFIKSCLAYCHITIPSLSPNLTKLKLFFICGEIACFTSCFSQCEAFIKAGISFIPELRMDQETNERKQSLKFQPHLLCNDNDTNVDHSVTRGLEYSVHSDVLSTFSCFLSYLVYVPSVSVQNGPFYLFRGFLNAVRKMPLNTETGSKTKIFLRILKFLCVKGRKVVFPPVMHRFNEGVETDDVLYGGTSAYETQLQEYVDAVIDDILIQIADIGKNLPDNGSPSTTKEMVAIQHKQAQSLKTELILDLINEIVLQMELVDLENTSNQHPNEHVALISKLCSLAEKSISNTDECTKEYYHTTIQFIQRQSSCFNDQVKGEKRPSFAHQQQIRAVQELSRRISLTSNS